MCLQSVSSFDIQLADPRKRLVLTYACIGNKAAAWLHVAEV